jgi:hypothetical protein
MLVVLLSVAYGQELETWVGGGVSGGITAFTESGFDSADPLTTQAEVDGMVGWGWGHVRADLDLHFYLPALGDEGGDVIAYPSIVSGTDVPMPEWLMVQIGREQHARLGIVNPNLGVEDWDPWINYAPSFSQNFVYVGAGRFAGADIGISTDNGYDYFAFGGWDLDWASWGGGAGVATLQDAYSTWSGIVLYPEFAGGGCPDGEGTCFNAFAQIALELYPAEPLWIALEAYPGVKGGSFYTSTQLVANILPEAVVNPYVRGEVLIDPDEVTGAPGHSVSVGGRSDLLEFIRVMVEAKAVFVPDADADLGVVVTLAVHRPEPNAYSFTDPFGAAEEE